MMIDITEMIHEYVYADMSALTDAGIDHLKKTDHALQVLLSPDQFRRLKEFRLAENSRMLTDLRATREEMAKKLGVI